MPIFAKKEDAPEAQRESAVELKDGRWFVESAPDPALGEAGKRALDAERTRASEAERQATEAKEALAKLQREQKARERGVSEDELQRIRTEEETARAPIIAERDRLAAENRKLKLDDRLRALYLEHGGMTDRIDDAMLIIGRRADLGDKDGIVFKDETGNVTADDAKAFFEKFKSTKKFLFRGTGSTGSGSEGSEGSENTGTFDPVAAGKAAAAAQKKEREGGSLAFK